MAFRPRRIYDLTQEWGAGIPPWPYFPDPSVSSFHRFPRDSLHSIIVNTAMHVGTHVDAPLHFNPRGWDCAEIPLDVLCGEGVVVDLEGEVGEYDVITPEMVEKKAEVREGDILVLHTGWHRYYWLSKERDEEKYFAKHPGPHVRFAEWALKKKLRWIGADTPALDHPLNTAIRNMRPDLVAEMEKKFNRSIEDILPKSQFLQVHKITANNNIPLVENLAGEIDQVLGKRLYICALPWRFIRGEASICRVVAFE